MAKLQSIVFLADISYTALNDYLTSTCAPEVSQILLHMHLLVCRDKIKIFFKHIHASRTAYCYMNLAIIYSKQCYRGDVRALDCNTCFGSTCIPCTF